MRRVIDVVLPKGSAWRLAPGLDLDLMYDGMASSFETVRLFLADLTTVRDPKKTDFLIDLEREFGVLTNFNLTEKQRRDQLSSIVFNRQRNGSIDSMQQALDDAGFNVQVHENSPAVDPELFFSGAFQMVAGGGSGYAGRSDAYAGESGGELLVNGDIFTTEKIPAQTAGHIFAGDGTTAGEYDDLERTKIVYPTPTNPDDWPMVFFVGGDATRNGSGELTDIESADIISNQEAAFKRIILKYKPIHSWAGLIVNFV